MPHQTESIVNRIRGIARHVGSLSPDEGAAIHIVADRLHELYAEEGDLLSWLDCEQRLNVATDEVADLLEGNGHVNRREMAESMRELAPVLRGVRAARLRERFAGLPDQLIAASTDVLRKSLADRLKGW